MAKKFDDAKVTEIFVGTTIIFHVDDEDYELDEELVADALKAHKVKFKAAELEVERDDDYLL